jgi:hypothetical protein
MDEFILDIHRNAIVCDKLYRYAGDSTPKTEVVINYDFPTSWTSSIEVCRKLAEDMPNPIFLVLSGDAGVFNSENKFDENEYILPPMRLRVGNKVDRRPYFKVSRV